LSIYLNQHASLKQTARVLGIHVNTVSYRIQRVERLTSLDLANPDHRLSAHVAAKIIESRRDRTLAGRQARPCPAKTTAAAGSSRSGFPRSSARLNSPGSSETLIALSAFMSCTSRSRSGEPGG
jgi:hypothetical protein